jgi:NAD(P)-dependent dehydrogenase (short-subunit alcohol dehydrogenase family)
MSKILQDKLIIVTGGSGLLGKAMLKDISDKGGVAVNFEVNLQTDLSNHEVQCDITSYSSIRESVKQVLEHYERIDGLVNNAYPRTKDWGSSFEEMSPESLRTNVDWQLNSYLLICREVIPLMKERKAGSIVNMTSIYGVVGNDFTIYEDTEMEPPAAYSAIKGGLINASRFLASKYGKNNIRVNCVSPGGIFDHQPESFVKAYEKKVPMKRMGNPEDIAPAVSFFIV